MIAPPSKIKLYFINQGICKRVTLTDPKYSDDIKVSYRLLSANNMHASSPSSQDSYPPNWDMKAPHLWSVKPLIGRIFWICWKRECSASWRKHSLWCVRKKWCTITRLLSEKTVSFVTIRATLWLTVNIFDPKSSPALFMHTQTIVKSIKEVNLRQRSSCLKSIEMNKTYTKRWIWESNAIKFLTIMLYRRKNSLRWCHTQGFTILNSILNIDWLYFTIIESF